jgi:hypothetical protein
MWPSNLVQSQYDASRPSRGTTNDGSRMIPTPSVYVVDIELNDNSTWPRLPNREEPPSRRRPLTKEQKWDAFVVFLFGMSIYIGQLLAALAVSEKDLRKPIVWGLIVPVRIHCPSIRRNKSLTMPRFQFGATTLTTGLLTGWKGIRRAGTPQLWSACLFIVELVLHCTMCVLLYCYLRERRVASHESYDHFVYQTYRWWFVFMPVSDVPDFMLCSETDVV